MTLSIMGLFVTLGINGTLNDDTHHNSIECHYAKCCYAECHVFIVMHSVVRLDVVVLRVVAQDMTLLYTLDN